MKYLLHPIFACDSVNKFLNGKSDRGGFCDRKVPLEV